MNPRASLIRIMTLVIANAEPKAVQKEMVLTALDSGLITPARAYELFSLHGLHLLP